MNWFEPNNWSSFWAEAQKGMKQSWPAGPGMPFPGMAAAPGPNAAAEGLQQMNDLVKRSLEGWATLMQAATPQAGTKAGFDPATLGRLFDPAEWSKAMSSGVDLSLERLTEGPTYATLTDLDRKVANAQKLWLQRAKDVEEYRRVVQAAWGRAFEQFTRALNDAAAPPLTSARAVLDLWLNLANEALLEMHHRPEFLEAQRRMTRSSAEYRLQEQQLAEVFCTANHIPTRTEMDEVQRTMHELRRELRALKRRLPQGEQA